MSRLDQYQKLLEAASRQSEALDRANDQLDSKAWQLLAVSGGLAGLFVTSQADSADPIAFSLLLGLGIICWVVSMISCLEVLRPRPFRTQLNAKRTVQEIETNYLKESDEEFYGQMLAQYFGNKGMSASEQRQSILLNAEVVNVWKSWWLLGGMISFAAAVLFTGAAVIAG